MKIRLLHATLEQKPILQRLLQLYLHEFSAWEGLELNGMGEYSYHSLDLYWTEPERIPHLIRVDGRWAGFALAMEDEETWGQQRSWVMAEFYVLERYRRWGIGRRVAYWIFNRYPGRWKVSQITPNLGAIAFWRNVIGAYTSGDYSETTDQYLQDADFLIQSFDNSSYYVHTDPDPFERIFGFSDETP